MFAIAAMDGLRVGPIQDLLASLFAIDGLTNGEHIIRTLIQRAKEGDMRAIEYVLERMGGKPQQSVEVNESTRLWRKRVRVELTQC